MLELLDSIFKETVLVTGENCICMQTPNRKSDSHKGENGKVTVVAGSKDFTGAPALASKAALRTGADLVTTVTSNAVADTVASYSPNFIVRDYPGSYLGLSGVETVLKSARKSDVALIGPGLSKPDEAALKEIFERVNTKWVIDADAIKPAVETEVTNAVFTPHKDELKHIEEKYGSPEKFVEETGNVVVLKGRADRIYSRNEVKENETGTSAMTVGGTGDVLAGVVSSLIAQGLDLKEAGLTGSYINGKAGELAAQEFGNGLLATDLTRKIPEAMKEF